MAPRLKLLPPNEPAAQGELSDAELLLAFERGDLDRSRLLYEHLVRSVEATLFRVLGERGPEHDDLVQSAFEQILITLREKRFARACSLRAWAASIATNLALNALRSRTVQRRYFDRDEDVSVRLPREANDDNPETAVAVRSEIRELRRHLADMSNEYAQALLLHDAFGYELAEIAVLAGASVAAVQSRLVRARKELRGRLEAQGIRQRGGAP